MKCERGVATELCLFEDAVGYDSDRKLSATGLAVVDGTMDTVPLCGATMGVEVVVPRTDYHRPEIWEGNNPVVNFVHLFVDEDIGKGTTQW